MSALVLHKIPKGSIYSYTCEEPDCKKKGRFRIEIAGHAVLSAVSVGTPQQAQLCEGCGRKARKLWRELNGEQAERDATAAIKLLAAPSAPKRVEAIDALRELGFSPPRVRRAPKQVAKGISAREVLDGLAA